jgi:hypothetical protein
MGCDLRVIAGDNVEHNIRAIPPEPWASARKPHRQHARRLCGDFQPARLRRVTTSAAGPRSLKSQSGVAALRHCLFAAGRHFRSAGTARL